MLKYRAQQIKGEKWAGRQLGTGSAQDWLDFILLEGNCFNFFCCLFCFVFVFVFLFLNFT